MFAGTRTQIDVVIMQEDTNGVAFFKREEGLFRISELDIPLPEQPANTNPPASDSGDGSGSSGTSNSNSNQMETVVRAAHSIDVGKGRNYLAFKMTSRPYLYLMATCQYDEFFEKDTFTC